MTKPCAAMLSIVSPYITVLNVDRSIEFYQIAFTFAVHEKVPGEDGVTFHAEMKYREQLLMFGKQGVKGWKTKTPAASGIESPIAMYIYCDDVDKFHAHAVKHGAKSLLAPEDTFWGDRMCRLEDLDGYMWAFATRINKS